MTYRSCLFLAAFSFFISATPAAADPLPHADTIDHAAFKPGAKVTIVNYWATWCAPCRAEMPLLDAYYRKHHAQGLALLAVSLDDGVSDRKLHQVTAKFAFPVARIADVHIARKDIPRAVPTTRIYDASGKLVFATRGDGRSTIDVATLDRIVTPLLAKP